MARGYRINMKSVNQRVARSRKYQQRADVLAKTRFTSAYRQLLEDFDHHPVTKELSGGPDGSNLSDTLGGYGNLFSYMGFPAGVDPTVAVKNFLRSAIKMRKRSNLNQLGVEYNIRVPSLADFDFAQMPWESGKSWVRGIETGVSGFNYYMNKAADASRSGGAIQIDGELRSRTSSSGVKYMSKILKNFKKRVFNK